MKLEIEKTENISANNIQVEVPNSVEISEGKKDYEVSVVKKEYTIIGDSIFIPSMYEDSPPWLKELINTTIDVAVINRDQSLIDRMHAILTAMDYVPKNQYTEQINQIVSEDGIINSRIATLNSNLIGAINTTNATIAEINLTYASKDEAAAIAINALTASLSGSGEIGSALIQLQEAYATLENTTAQSINILESVMEGEITGNATAMETIRTYVGIDEAGASTGTGLSAYLEASDGTIGGADSQLVNDVRVTAEGVESKFAYNSIVNINGIYKKSGFGLSTNYTSGKGTEESPYISEFWIDASRLKFTNSNQTGQVAPFTIDATGLTPRITFNGVVDFTNTNIANGYSGTTKINGGIIQTETVTATQIKADSVSADRLKSTTGASTVWEGGGLVSANFNGNVTGNIGTPTAGFRLSSNAAGTTSDPNVYGAYIKGGIIEGSYIRYGSNYILTNSGTLSPYFITDSLNFNGNTTAYTGSFSRLYSPSYGSGYLSTRLSRYAQKILIFGGIAGDIDLVTLTIEYSYDGGTWNTLYTGSVYMDYRHSLSMSTEVTLRSTPYNYVDFRVVVSGSFLQTLGMTLLSNNI